MAALQLHAASRTHFVWSPAGGSSAFSLAKELCEWFLSDDIPYHKLDGLKDILIIIKYDEHAHLLCDRIIHADLARIMGWPSVDA